MHLLFLVTLCGLSFFIHLQQMSPESKRKYEVVFLGVVLFLFAALRAPSVGIDIQRYCDSYRVVAEMNFGEILDPNGRYALRDPIFHCFMRILAYFSEDPQLLLAVVGAWVAITFSVFVYNTGGHVLNTFLLFICLRIYSFTLTGLRQSIAMGFVWLAFVCLQKKKYALYFVFLVAATCFHLSAIAFLLAIPLMLIKNNNLVLGSVLCFATANFLLRNRIVYYISNLFFFERFGGHVDIAMESETSFSSTFFLYIAMFIFIIFFFKQVKKDNPNSIGLFNLACFGLMISFVSQGFPNLFRIAYYYICCLFPLFTQTVNVSGKQSERIVFNMFIPVLLIAQYLVLGTSGGTENYIFFWQA